MDHPTTPTPADEPRHLIDYVELHCHSAFSLLDGASTPEALVKRAHALGYRALAITDHNELGGVVRFAGACEFNSMGGIIGSELTVDVPANVRALHNTEHTTRTHLTVLAETREGYQNLSQLITHARMNNDRGEPAVPWSLLVERTKGLTVLTGCPRGWIPRLITAGKPDDARIAAGVMHDVFGEHLAIECWDHRLHEERIIVRELQPLAKALNIPWAVTNNVHYATAEQRLIHDVLCSLRHNLTLDEMGTRLRPNAEWGLKDGGLIYKRWQGAEEGVRETVGIAERCVFRLAHLQPSLPEAFQVPDGMTAEQFLRKTVYEGAAVRYAGKMTPKHHAQIDHELDMIGKMGFAGFFLTVLDIVNFARREGILCQGRGSAANSAVCYCLYITAVDPIGMTLLFERFLSGDRVEYPDIDIDFAHRERERVLQYVYNKYGRAHAAMVCEHITWRGRSAVRDAARVLGFSTEQSDILATFSDRFSAKATADTLRVGEEKDEVILSKRHETARESGERHWQDRYALDSHKSSHTERRDPTTSVRPVTSGRELFRQAGFDPDDIRVRLLADVVAGLHGLPRHRSIHVGGFILTAQPLGEVVPIEPASMADRTVIQWEKDDLDGAKLVKIDLLGLGMLTVLQDCLAYIRQTRGLTIDLGQLEMTDSAVYDTMCAADTVGVFQIESRAQMSTLPRLKPRKFYDLVVEVALIRPGPIQGDMVHPYLRRRAGEEEVSYFIPSLQPILERTMGVPLFQEQGMQVAVAAAGFTKLQADQLRRAMARKRSHESMNEIVQKLLDGMEKNGIDRDVAKQIYHQINAFADYGFPESHAASFALIVYASAYLRFYYAPEFTAAILNAQPMGFYSPSSLVEDARRHNVEVRPIDFTKSRWDHTIEMPDGRTLVPHDGKLSWDNPQPKMNADDTAFRNTLNGTSNGISNNTTSKSNKTASNTTHNTTQSISNDTSNKSFDNITATDDDVPLLPNFGYASCENGTPQPAVRLGVRLVRGLGSKARVALESALENGPFTSISDFVQRVPLDKRSLRALAESGAFDSMFPHERPDRRRRVALWELLAASRGELPLAPMLESPVPSGLMPLKPVELTETDFRVTGLSLIAHPMQHLRETLRLNRVRTTTNLRETGKNGERVGCAGLVICRQRPGTAKGFVFLTLEDETGMLNVIVEPSRFEPDALLISTSPLLLIRGVLQCVHGVVNLRAHTFKALQAESGEGFAKGRNFH